jgi:hypothetical protein
MESVRVYTFCHIQMLNLFSVPETRTWWMTRVLMGLILTITLFNFAFIFYNVIAANFTSSFEHELRKLQYKSTYIGFESLYANKSTVPNYTTIINKPRFIGYVSADAPQAVIPYTHTYDLTPDGYVPAVEERLVIRKNVRFFVVFSSTMF